jgi:hypothetical protein
VERRIMTVTLEELTKLMYDTYETAAVRREWYTPTHVSVPWAQVPEENRAAMRDSIAAVERVIREDESSKYDTGSSTDDIVAILKALDMSTHPRTGSSSETVHREIIPKIRELKSTLNDVRSRLIETLSMLK